MDIKHEYICQICLPGAFKFINTPIFSFHWMMYIYSDLQNLHEKTTTKIYCKILFSLDI